jgi:hypothetical protein
VISRPRPYALILAILLGVTALASAQAPTTPGTAPAPGARPAPPEVVAQLMQALAYGVQRFEAMDAEGVLTQISDRYRSGPLTKPAARQQLYAIFAAHDLVRARIRIDEVRMVGDRAWVYSTGEVTGRVRFLGTVVRLYAWERQAEIARIENGRWMLIGDG